MAEKYEEFVAFFEAWKKVSDVAFAQRTEYLDLSKKDDVVAKKAFEDNDNEDVKKFKEYEAKANEQIEAIKAKVKEAKAATLKKLVGDRPEVSEDDLKAKRDAFLASRKKFDLTKKNILALLDDDQAALKAGMDAYEIQDVPNLGGGSANTGTTGIVRKRLSGGTYNGEDAADKSGKVTFTNLSLKSGLTGNEIREAAANAAGVSDVKDIPAGTTVNFTVTKDGKVHSFSITTKDSE